MLDVSLIETLGTCDPDDAERADEGGSPTKWAADSGTGVGGGDKTDPEAGGSAFCKCWETKGLECIEVSVGVFGTGSSAAGSGSAVEGIVRDSIFDEIVS